MFTCSKWCFAAVVIAISLSLSASGMEDGASSQESLTTDLVVKGDGIGAAETDSGNGALVWSRPTAPPHRRETAGQQVWVFAKLTLPSDEDKEIKRASVTATVLSQSAQMENLGKGWYYAKLEVEADIQQFKDAKVVATYLSKGRVFEGEAQKGLTAFTDAGEVFKTLIEDLLAEKLKLPFGLPVTQDMLKFFAEVSVTLVDVTELRRAKDDLARIKAEFRDFKDFFMRMNCSVQGVNGDWFTFYEGEIAKAENSKELEFVRQTKEEVGKRIQGVLDNLISNGSVAGPLEGQRGGVVTALVSIASMCEGLKLKFQVASAGGNGTVDPNTLNLGFTINKNATVGKTYGIAITVTVEGKKEDKKLWQRIPAKSLNTSVKVVAQPPR